MATQSFRRSREPVLALCRVYATTKHFWRRMSDPEGGRKEVPQGRNGSVNPLALRRRPTITKSLRGNLIKDAYKLD